MIFPFIIFLTTVVVLPLRNPIMPRSLAGIKFPRQGHPGIRPSLQSADRT